MGNFISTASLLLMVVCCMIQTDRTQLKRSESSRGSAVSSSCSSSNVAARRPSLHTVGDIVASRGLVSPPPTLPSRSRAAAAAGPPWSPGDPTSSVVVLPRCLERLLCIDSVAVRSAMDRSLVKVHLANGCFNVLKCSDSTTVKVCPHYVYTV